jgi:hypothetical protein
MIRQSVWNRPIIINNHNIEKVMEFKYLGSLINNNNKSITEENNHRILLANRCYYELRNLLQSKTIKVRYEVQNLQNSGKSRYSIWK